MYIHNSNVATTEMNDNKVPTPTTQQLEVPTATTQQLEVPTATTQQLEAPTPTTQQLEVPTATTQQLEVPTATTQQLEVPTATTQQLATSYWDQPEVNISSLLRCQSSDQSGLVYTPNIPNFYFNVMNAAAFNPESRVTNRNTFIFTINSESPLRNCNGTVVSLQYCYQARNGDMGNIIFLSLAQNGMQVRVKNRITIRTTPQNNKCIGDTEQICCVTGDLQPRQRFKITSSMYSFGVVINGRRPLSFTTLATENYLKQYQVPVGMDTRMRFTLSEDDRLNNPSFILLRFLIGNLVHPSVIQDNNIIAMYIKQNLMSACM